MPKKVIKITTHLAAIPSWLKINNSISFNLPLQSSKELATKLLEIREDVEVEINFATGKEPSVEINYESRKDTEK
jgi:hypothetical protein